MTTSTARGWAPTVRPASTERSPAARSRRAPGVRRLTAMLEATVRIVGVSGTSAVTHRSLATEAGVPLAATTYYFSSRQDIIVQTLEHVVRGETARLHVHREGLSRRPATPEEAVAVLYDSVFRVALAERVRVTAQLEIFLECARRPELRDTAESWTRAQVGLVDALLPEELPGRTERERDRVVRTVVASLDGLMLEELATGSLGEQGIRESLLCLLEVLWPGSGS